VLSAEYGQAKYPPLWPTGAEQQIAYRDAQIGMFWARDLVSLSRKTIDHKWLRIVFVKSGGISEIR
jgi:hypothetical protein